MISCLQLADAGAGCRVLRGGICARKVSHERTPRRVDSDAADGGGGLAERLRRFFK